MEGLKDICVRWNSYRGGSQLTITWNPFYISSIDLKSEKSNANLHIYFFLACAIALVFVDYVKATNSPLNLDLRRLPVKGEVFSQHSQPESQVKHGRSKLNPIFPSKFEHSCIHETFSIGSKKTLERINKTRGKGEIEMGFATKTSENKTIAQVLEQPLHIRKKRYSTNFFHSFSLSSDLMKSEKKWNSVPIQPTLCLSDWSFKFHHHSHKHR